MSSKVSLSGWQFGHLHCAPKLAAISESKIIIFELNYLTVLPRSRCLVANITGHLDFDE